MSLTVVERAPDPGRLFGPGRKTWDACRERHEIGLFEALERGPTNLEELTNRIAVPLRTTGIVAAALVGLGLIEEEGGRYQNSEGAATFLAGNARRPWVHPTARSRAWG